MKKIVVVLVVSLFVSVYGFSADTVKKPAAVVKEVPKDLKVTAPEAVKPAAVKTAEVVVNDFEADKLTVKGLSFMGDAATGFEETVGDKLVLEQEMKKVKTGKKSLKLTYVPQTADEKKFARVMISSENLMGGNNAVSFYVLAEKGKGSIEVNLYTATSKKWISQTINADKNEWVLVTMKDSDFVPADKRDGKWENINNLQLIIKGSGVFYFDNIKFIKAAK